MKKLASLLLLAMPLAAAQDAPNLRSDEIKAAFVGKRIEYPTDSQNVNTTYILEADGTGNVIIKGLRGGRSYSLKWRLTERHQLCWTVDRPNSKEACANVRKNADGSFSRVVREKVTSTFTVN